MSTYIRWHRVTGKGAYVILHVAELDKFIPPFVELIKKEFNPGGHYFWLNGPKERYDVVEDSKLYLCHEGFWAKVRAYSKLIVKLHSADKVILHGLFNIKVIVVLAIFPWLLSKCYWVIWGGDLYQFNKNKASLYGRAKEVLRSFVIQRVGNLVTYVPGDVALARKWYGANGAYHQCLMYLSNIVSSELLQQPECDKVSHTEMTVLVGNSAHPSNNHIEALEKLLPYKSQAIKIYVPLSYGDQMHAKKVIKQGQEWFGDKFIPLTEFMPIEEYSSLLTGVDIAIFNHKRQQAMGNTIMLLGLGKTVFMRDDVSQWELLTGMRLKIRSVAEFSLDLLSCDDRATNSMLIRAHFSEEKLVKQLDNIFRS